MYISNSCNIINNKLVIREWKLNGKIQDNLFKENCSHFTFQVISARFACITDKCNPI